LSVTTILLIVVALVVVAAGLVGLPENVKGRWRFVAIAGLAGAAGIATILASPAPGNDVWYEYQAASSALLHGHNFYLTHWTSLPGETSNVFNYLPVSVLLLAPFHALLGDVRFGLLAASLFAGWCAYRLAGEEFGWLCGGFVLLFPRGNFGIAMSWNDPLLLAGIAATALAVRHRRLGWATVALAVVLSSKQYAWLFLPFAALWEDFGWKRALASASAAVAVSIPWVVADPPAFWREVISVFVNARPNFGSLSLYTVALRHGVNPGLIFPVGLVLVSVTAGLLLLPRSAYGFLVGSALVMAWFNLGNKQSFFNQWALLGGLIALAMAVTLGNSENTPPLRQPWLAHLGRLRRLGAPGHEPGHHSPEGEVVPPGVRSASDVFKMQGVELGVKAYWSSAPNASGRISQFRRKSKARR
jgi:hypothetical protein